MSNLRILFLLKKNYTSGGEATGLVKAGLMNSVEFLATGLHNAFHIDYHISVCVDANDIDREVHNFRPDICILEALWYTPEKLLEIQRLHRRVLFIVRINSKIPFLALEGMSIGWLKQYLHNSKKAGYDNLVISTNNKECSRDLNGVDIKNVYLPNLYPPVPGRKETFVNKISEEARYTLNLPVGHGKKAIDVGCFGAIRPLKNQLIQAVAAIEMANRNKLILNFHINGSRVEQRGEEPLKNIRALFEKSGHNLVEHSWLTHEQFLRLISQMDLSLQVSFTESFNIVTADTISQYIPVVVSPDIDWVPAICHADPNDAEDIIKKIETVLDHRSMVVRKTVDALNMYVYKATREWFHFLYPVECEVGKL